MANRNFISSPLGIGLLVLVAIGVGLAIGAVAFGGDDDGSGGGGGEVGTAPISLPEKLGEFTDLVQASEAQGGSAKVVEDQAQNQEKVAKATVDAYSEAFGGAAAGYRAYADDELLRLPYVIAVRAEAPGLTTGPVVEPAYLGLAKPEREVRTVGPVECQIAWSPPVVAGDKPDPESEIVTNCQRSEDGLTVIVGSSGFTGPEGLKSMTDLTSSAWKAVGGSSD